MHPSDKDFDRHFREAADRFEPDDSMLSWSRLEKNLSGQLPERPPGPPRRFGFRPLVWVPAAVLFAGLSIFLIKNRSQYRSLSTPTSSASPAPDSNAPGADGSRLQTAEGLPTDSIGAIANRSGSDAVNDSPILNGKTMDNGDGTDNENDIVNGNTSGSGKDADIDNAGAGNSVSGADRFSGTAAGNKNNNKNNPSARLLEPVSGTEPNAAPDPANNPGVSAATHPEAAPRSKKGRLTEISASAPANTGLTVNDKRKKQRNYKGRMADRNQKNKNGQPADGGMSENKSRENLENTKMVQPESSDDIETASWFSRPKVSDNTSNLNDDVQPAETHSGSGNNSSATPGAAVAVRPEFARTHLPGLGAVAGPSVHTNDDGLKAAAAQNKPLPLPSRSVHVRQPLTFGLVMGPDYTYGGIASSQLGNSVGVSVSYYLTSRLSVNTGLLYDVKSYAAKGQDFQPPRTPVRAPGSYPHFESANGTVYLFEIPLSIRYDIPVGPKTRLFVNAGLSSYLPIKERYTTFFREQGRVYAWRQENDNPDKHWFGIGHFTGGVERDLAKGLSFQAEPYFNLPFTNVCTGKVKLNTYGLLFSIRYTPVLSRKKG